MTKAKLLEVTQPEHGLKLLQFLQRRLGEVPRSAIMKWIRTGQVRTDSKRCKPFDRLNAGQQVRVPPFAFDHAGPESAPQDTPELPALSILFEDDDILAINKPAGLPVQPGSGHVDSVVTRLRQMYADAPFMPAPAHRIDRDTTGLVLAGKSYAGLRHLSDAFAQRTVKKTYLAWVHGQWPYGMLGGMSGEEPEDGNESKAVAGEVTLHDQMDKVRKGNLERMETGCGKEAICKVRALQLQEGYSLLEIDLLTGRTHQIRVQLSSRGHAIVGDRKYGSKPVRGKQGLMLHAWKAMLDGVEYEAVPEWSDRFAVQP